MNLLGELGITVQTAATFESLLELDNRLSASGFHPLTPWWRDECRRFYETNAREWAARVGRGGSKSTVIAKIAANETLNGSWKVPPGECHYFALVAENKDEAQNRLLLLEGYLRALGVLYNRSGPTIRLKDRPLGFKVFAARIGAVSGFRAIGRACDEVAKWNDEGTDPSEEVWTSLGAMCVTHRNACGLLFSSPMGMTGLHFDAVEKGDVPNERIVSIAPSWVANPSITEEHTKKLAKTPRVWKREYLAIPQGSLTSVFEPEIIEKSFNAFTAIERKADHVLVIDASRGGDAWAFGESQWVWSNGKARLSIFNIGECPEASDSGKSVAWLASKTTSRIVLADQYMAGALASLFAQHGFTFIELPWTSTSKRQAVDKAERMMRDETLIMIRNEKLRRQLLEYQERITRSGELSYAGSGRNDDYAAIVLTTMLGDLERKLSMVEEPTKELVRGSPEYWRDKEQKYEQVLIERLRQAQRDADDDLM